MARRRAGYTSGAMTAPLTRALALTVVALLVAFVSACGGDGEGGGPPGPVPSLTATTSPLPAPDQPVHDVLDFGARGDGETDDTAAVLEAFDAARADGGLVYLPGGTYLVHDDGVDLPDGVRLRGDGVDHSWFAGRLDFGSDSTVQGLRIGRPGTCAITNRDGARGTTFVDVRFHGGGSEEGVDSSVVFLGGTSGSVSDVLFLRCAFERTSYVPPEGVDAYAANVGNTISIHEYTDRPDSAHVEGITFRECRLGASNGRKTGALRMMMEAYCWDERTGRVLHGWRDLTLEDCLIEASDTTGLDFADQPLSDDPSRRAASGALVTGCTFLGARKNDAFAHGGLPIVYEAPTGIAIRDNVFYASPGSAIGGSHTYRSDAPGLVVEGNTFDMTRSRDGLTHDPGEPVISLVGHGSRVEGNRFVYDSGMGVTIKAGGGDTVYGTNGNVVRDNVFVDSRTSGGEPTILLEDEDGLGCRDNRIEDNEITNRGAGDAGVIRQDTGDNTNFVTGNRIRAGNQQAVVAAQGRLVVSGNRVDTGTE
jgi:hypothetical protein